MAGLILAQSMFMLFLRVADGTLTYSQALDLQKDGHSPNAGDVHRRMKMNIKTYEHALLPVLRTMEAERAKLNALHGALRACYAETGQASEFEDVYRQQLLKFGAAGEALSAAIVERGAAIGAEHGSLRHTWRRLIYRAS